LFSTSYTKNWKEDSKNQKQIISGAEALEIAENVFEIQIKSPITKKNVRKILLLTDEQKYLACLFNF
jgi:hypothetical protein